MYSIAHIVHGLSYQDLHKWIGEELTELAGEIDLVEQPYSGNCVPTEYVGYKFTTFDALDVVDFDKIVKRVVVTDEVTRSVNDSIMLMLDALQVEEDITPEQYKQFVATIPPLHTFITWSTS